MRIQALANIANALAAACTIAATQAAAHELRAARPARPSAVSTITLLDSRPTAAASTPPHFAAANNHDNPQLKSLLLAAVTWGASADVTNPAPTARPDIPATVSFAAVFAAGAIAHAVQCVRIRKLRMPHLRPVLAALVLVFCLLRVAACGVRISWVRTPGDEELMIVDGVLLNVGSVVMFIAIAILGQRLLRYLSQTSLDAPRVRRVGAWLSEGLLKLAMISSVIIVVLYTIGASRASKLSSSQPASNEPQATLMLLRASIALLAAYGALPLLLVATVLLAVRGAHLRQLDRIKAKLLVFFLGGALLEIGQCVRLAAVFPAGRSTSSGRVPFYVAGFLLEVFVVLLSAVFGLDVLLSHDEHMSSIALADGSSNNDSRWRPTSAPVGFSPTDEHGLPRRASTTAGDRAGGILVRKSVKISVVRLYETAPPRRSLSR